MTGLPNYKGFEHYITANDLPLISGNLTTEQKRMVLDALKHTEKTKESELMQINEFIEYSKIEMKREWVNEFWKFINGSKFIPLNEKRTDMMGYKKSKDMYKDIVKKIKENFIEGEDYQECRYDLKECDEDIFRKKTLKPSTKNGKKSANSTDAIRGKASNGIAPYGSDKGGRPKKLYEVTPDCFKNMLMMANTSKAKEIRKYFLGVEKLFHIYSEYVSQWKMFQQHETQIKYYEKKEKLIKEQQTKKEKELKIKIEEQSKELNSIHKHNEELLEFKLFKEQNQLVYITTTKQYAKQGLFKVGKTKLTTKQRNSSLNTSRVAGDEVITLKEFKTYDAGLLEKTIHTLLNSLRPVKNREFFMCPYNLLVDIISNVAENNEMNFDLANNIIRAVHKIKNEPDSETKYTVGLPMDIFEPKSVITKQIKQVKEIEPEIEPESEDESESESEDENEDEDESKSENEKLNEALSSKDKMTNEKIKFIVSGMLKRFVNKTYKIDLNKNKKKLNIDWMDYQTDLKKALNVKITGIAPWRKELKTLVDNNKLLTATWRR